MIPLVMILVTILAAAGKISVAAWVWSMVAGLFLGALLASVDN